MVTKRKSHEAGHRRKFLVVIDDTSECDRAVIYAARRAASTGGALTMLMVIEPGQFQHWLGVEEIMKAEAREAAEEVLARFDERVRAVAQISPESVIRDGMVAEQISDLINEDEDIAILVLAAATGSGDGPGPLVSSIANHANGAFHIPVTIVPGDLSDEDIEALA
ncbi:universal stress protein [Cohaesibacter gelatinilyticus]|uniref:Nucleotide-binding universal stress protein, UspA family n=1 Tax=Cohaesibacter gelatinilyticus TaxID=372072 RepID=A0A285PE08_9HYPH|nr:universal stress protein [Cohaesibacter gelatinilyticus]SNZ19965.1 Nucleotide-binding universal stress protein, UspA family [Cohaesibacter gelatinilyticus]